MNETIEKWSKELQEITLNNGNGMDIEELVWKLKERRDIVREPVRLRRKRSKGRRGSRLGLDSAQTAERNRTLHRARQKALAKTVSGAYKHLTRAYRARDKRRTARSTKPVKWLLSLEDWKTLWKAAGAIHVGQNVYSAFELRGKHPDDVKLWRIDEDKDWTLDNCVILYKGAILANGRKLNV